MPFVGTANPINTDDTTNNQPVSGNLYGLDANDFLSGDAGSNQIYGGQDRDVLVGAPYTAFTGNGTQGDPFVLTTFGPSGDDYLEGGRGRDTAYGADGNDVIYGGDGDDQGVVASFG